VRRNRTALQILSALGPIASILPCPRSRSLSTIPDITSDRDPSACCLPAPDLQTTGTATAAPASDLERWLPARSPSRSAQRVEVDAKEVRIMGSKSAHCCACSSPSQAQKQRVLALPVLFGSGAPDKIRTNAVAACEIINELPVTIWTQGFVWYSGVLTTPRHPWHVSRPV
jgi:hypothetical protein